MYCKKCYRKVDLTWARCHCCGNPINQENVTNDENMIKKLKKEENESVIIYVVFYLINLFAMFAFTSQKFIFFLGALATLVTGFIKYPNNNIMKTIFVISIVLLGMLATAIFFFMYVCLGLTRVCLEIDNPGV